MDLKPARTGTMPIEHTTETQVKPRMLKRRLMAFAVVLIWATAIWFVYFALPYHKYLTANQLKTVGWGRDLKALVKFVAPVGLIAAILAAIYSTRIEKARFRQLLIRGSLLVLGLLIVGGIIYVLKPAPPFNG